MPVAPAWNPQRYLHRSGPRTRPFHDLLAHVPDLPSSPARIVDLGCGAGEVTAILAERWPDAHVTGYDNATGRLREAERFAGERAAGGRVDFRYADIGAWLPEEPVDLLLSNAAIQWVPDQPDRFAGWTRTLTPGGVFAFQVPDNAASVSHTVLRELCASPRWRGRLASGVLGTPEVHDPARYLDRLAALGFTVDAWETTYAHLLPAEDPFAGWINGTGMDGVVAALADEPGAIEEFLAAYRTALREAYPARPYGTVFPFRRIFAVATRPGAA